MKRLLLFIFGILIFSCSVRAEETQPVEPTVYGRAAVLRTIISSGNSTRSVSADFNALIQKNLQNQKIEMADLGIIEERLKKHPYEVLSAGKDVYTKLGTVLQADYLLIPRINQFDVKNAVVLIDSESKALLRRTGIFEGILTIVDAKSGKNAVAFPFSEKVDFSAIPEKTDDWNILVYYDYMMKKAAVKLSAAAGTWLRDHMKK